MTSEQPPQDKVKNLEPLLEAVRGGDRDALEEIVDAYYDQVEKAVQRRLQVRFRNHSRSVAVMFSTGDVVHGVFLKVLAGKIQLPGATPAHLVAYLVKAVESQIVDMTKFHQAARRDRRRHQSPSESEEDFVQMTTQAATPVERAWDNEQRTIYVEVLESFDIRDRELLTLRIEHCKTFEHISVRLGFNTVDTARKAFHSAKARLLVRLASRGIDLPVPSESE